MERPLLTKEESKALRSVVTGDFLESLRVAYGSKAYTPKTDIETIMYQEGALEVIKALEKYMLENPMYR